MSRGWISVEEDGATIAPMGEEVCIKLRDGSELVGAILQSDLDWWWRERFFQPSEVTHWKPLQIESGGTK